jgi:hypothetical protein
MRRCSERRPRFGITARSTTRIAGCDMTAVGLGCVKTPLTGALTFRYLGQLAPPRTKRSARANPGLDGFGWGLCPHCRKKRFNPYDVHDAREFVSQHAQCHLARHAWQRLHQEVGGSHPGLDRAEGMLDSLAPRRIFSSARRDIDWLVCCSRAAIGCAHVEVSKTGRKI